MRVREFRVTDEPVLKAAYLERGFPGGWKPLDDAVAVVVVDENDIPIALAAAHLVAEVRTVVDQSFETPGLRQEAFLLAHDALHEALRELGVKRAVAQLELPTGRGFSKRLARLRGWVQSRGICMERDV